MKNWLRKNKWGLTDIVLKTTRKKDSPSDQDLVPKEWNKRLIEKDHGRPHKEKDTVPLTTPSAVIFNSSKFKSPSIQVANCPISSALG